MWNIRLASRRDAAALAAIYAPHVEGSAVSFEVEPPTPEAMAARVDAQLESLPWIVATHAETVAGYAYASRHHERAAYRWSVDASVYVDSALLRRGVAGALYESLFALLLAQGFYTVHAGITLPNAASVGLHESLGFAMVARFPAVGWKLSDWHDVGYWQLALRERSGEPAPPSSLATLRATDAFGPALASGLHRLHRTS